MTLHSISPRPRLRTVPIAWLALAALLAHAPAALAGVHTWDVNEVFSNADGTIQFVELREANGTANETGVGNGSLSSTQQTAFSFGQGAVAAPTSNKFYLVATQSFADLPGAPVPDVIIPAGKIPFFATTGSTVSFGAIDSWAFGAVPTNGTDSLSRLTGVGPNSPTNYAGDTGSVDASPPPSPVPSGSLGVRMIVGAMLLAGGLVAVMGRRGLGAGTA